MIKPIPDWDGYFADELGNIYSNKISNSKDVRTHFKVLIKKLAGTESKYYIVSLSKNGFHINKYVSNLVLETFVSPRPEGMQACHGINGRFDDSLDNLSWGTKSKNCSADKYRDGTALFGEKNHRSKLNELQVRIIRRSYSPHGKGGLTQQELANIFHVHYAHIQRLLNHTSWSHIK
jgi:hypothetical protein